MTNGLRHIGNDSVARLFCVPYAGSSAFIYMKWQKYFVNSMIQIIPVELAGRGSRFEEPFSESLEACVEDAFRLLQSNQVFNGGQYALFGHSMGATIVYELYRKIKAKKLLQPKHIFISGQKPPHLMARNEMLHKMEKSQLVEKLRGFGGVTEDFIQNEELLDLFLPIIRADLKVIEEYEHDGSFEKFDCDVTVLHGTEDDISCDDVKEWSQYGSNLQIIKYEGGHFFIHSHTKDITKLIENILVN